MHVPSVASDLFSTNQFNPGFAVFLFLLDNLQELVCWRKFKPQIQLVRDQTN